MAAHLYWRINVTANAGDVSFLAMAEVEMRGTAGGADQCSGGTASASTASVGFEADKAFDNDASTRWSTTATLTGWLAYQFASPVDVVQYTIQAHPTTPARSPQDWTLEWSDDGSTWTAIESRTGYSSWTNGEIKTFTVPAVTNARVSQVAAEVLRTNLAPGARVSQVAAEVLRINTGNVVRASQIAVEVLRPNVGAAMTQRPQVFICT